MHNHTTVPRAHSFDQDPVGAILYVTIVLIWYSMGIAGMLIMQVKVNDEKVEDRARHRAKLFLATLNDHTHTKEILEELVDKSKREKLWKIYLDDRDDPKRRLFHAESIRIRNIEKQLALLDQHRRMWHESAESLACQCEHRLRSRRRSSFDQQILQGWKTIFEQCRMHEQLPWTIQRHLLRRHFRRHHKEFLRS